MCPRTTASIASAASRSSLVKCRVSHTAREALGKIPGQRDQKARHAQNPSGVSCPDAAAAQFADVLVQAQADQIIPRGEAAGDVARPKECL